MHIDKLSFDRIVFFSDAVFAIAITILVLEIKVPELHGPVTNAMLREALVNQLPKLGGFLISFFAIGTFWRGHHRLFSMLDSWDSPLVGKNLAFLAAISFLPYPTGVFSTYPSLPLAMVFYASAVIVVGLLQARLWLHAGKAGLLREGVHPEALRLGILRASVTPIVAALSIPASLFSPAYGALTYLLLPIAVLVIERRAKKVLGQSAHMAI